jgi:hypothetical protein
MSLNLGLGLGVSRGGGGGVTLATGLVLNLDMTTGQDYSALSITSSSAVGLVKGHNGLWVAKPAGYLAGLEGARVNGSAPAWDDGSGNALSGVRWTGPKAEETNRHTKSSNLTTWAANTGATYAAPWSQLRGAFSCYNSPAAVTSGRYEIGVLIRKVSSSGVVRIENPQDGTAGKWNVDTSLLAAGENWVTRNHPAVTIVSNFDATAFTGDVWFKVSSGSPEIDVRALTVVAGTSAPSGPIETSGTTLTRLAETVAFPQTPGDNWTAVVGVDLSSGVPPSPIRFLGFNLSGKTPLYSNGSAATSFDGVAASFPTLALTTGSTKVGARFANKKVKLKANSTLGTTSSDDFAVGATTSVLIGQNASDSYLSAPIATVKIWTRALTDVEFANV